MNKKMMVMPLLFLILMAVPMVNASEVNETVLDLPDDVLVILNVTEPDLASIQLQLYNIYDWMLTHDELLMNSRSSLRELNTTLNDAIMDIERSLRLERVRSDVAVDYAFNELRIQFIDIISGLVLQLLDSDAQLQGQVDTQGVVIEELRHEVSQVHEELMRERATRNNLTIMFGIFSLVIIGATVVINKK